MVEEGQINSLYMSRNYIAYKSELLMIVFLIGIRECYAFYVGLIVYSSSKK